MTNPELVALLGAWWDERRGWYHGTTSSVIADWCEDHVNDPGTMPDAMTLRWMRTGWYDEDDDRRRHRPDRLYGCDEALFDRLANVHQISTGTTANPKVRQMFQEFGIILVADHGLTWNDVARDAWVVLGPDTAGMIGLTREYRDLINAAVGVANGIAHRLMNEGPRSGLAMFGLPEYLYGYRLVLNDAQPYNQIDCVCGDVIITARVH